MATKQYHLPGGHKEIGEAIEELAKVNIIKPAHSPYNLPVWPVPTQDETWCMTVDHRKLNKVTAPLFSAMPKIASLLDQLSHELGTYLYVLDLVNAFPLLIVILKAKTSLPSPGKATSGRLLFCLKVNSPTVCHSLVLKTYLHGLCHALWDCTISLMISH